MGCSFADQRLVACVGCLLNAISEVIIMGFKEKLLLVRKERGLSQEQVAEAVGVSRQAVAKWESGLPALFLLYTWGAQAANDKHV